jgi:CO dehydrogenase maturation factor
MRPVLAVDADPNSTLAPLLGVAAGRRISDIREEIMKAKAEVSGVPKERLLEQELGGCVVESDGFDLLTMGRPEGRSCYCYVNNLLRGALESLRANYRLTVVDNEAGMEHLSRMNTADIDCLLVVTEPTLVGARSSLRILELADSLEVKVGRRTLVWNKVPPGGVPAEAAGILSGARVDAEFRLPLDGGLARLSGMEESVFKAELPEGAGGLLDACVQGGRVISSTSRKGEQ